MTSQRRCHERDSQNKAYIFYNTRFVAASFGNELADLSLVIYQNELVHVIIGPLGHIGALGATRLVQRLIFVAPSCLPSHNAPYIILKSMTKT